MKILIVTKTTNYELHGQVIEENVSQGRVSSDALSRLIVAHDEHNHTLELLKTKLDIRDIAYDIVSRDSKWSWDGTLEAIVTVGGDGTLLAASHNIQSAGGRLIGIRSSDSSVGYLCGAGMSEIGTLVDRIADKKIVWQQISRVRAEIQKASNEEKILTVPVVNDLLYANANPAATTRYKIRFRDRAETHRSSGIWVATGMGSTAAILAAGGVKRSQEDTLFQFRVRELYKLGHELPEIEGDLFDPDFDSLEIENRCPDAILATDGQHGNLNLIYGDVIRLKRGPVLQVAVGLHADRKLN